MATTALGTKLTAVYVVRAVASDARTCLANPAARRPRVASLTLQPDVGAGQVEVGLRVVVKPPIRPSCRAMASGAILAEPAFVLVVIGVAGRAFYSGVLVAAALMARRAFDADMFPDEGKARQSVIKPDRGGPANVAVALFALGALLARVRVIVAMT